jgi:hypothetical protein
MLIFVIAFSETEVGNIVLVPLPPPAAKIFAMMMLYLWFTE